MAYKSVYLNGSSQYLWKDEPSGLDITGDLTIEIRFKAEALGSNQVLVMMGNPTETEANNLLFSVFLMAGGIFRFLHEYGAGNNEDVSRAAADVVAGEWIAASFVRDTTAKTITVYINGNTTPVQTIGYTNNPTGGSNGDLHIGVDHGHTFQFFKGPIDDLRLWDKTRTPAEINSDYYQNLTGSEPNLIGYWNFNGDANDSTSSGNDLAEGGGPLTYITTAYTIPSPRRSALGDGSSATIQVPGDDFHTLTELSFSLFFNPSAIINSLAPIQGLIVKNTSTPKTSDHFFGFGMQGGMDGKLQFIQQNGGGEVRSTIIEWQPNAWYHAGVTFKVGEPTLLYVNGVLNNTGSNGVSIGDNGSHLYIMSNKDDLPGAYYFFNGKVDLVRGYNRKLSAFEMQKLFYFGQFSAPTNGLKLRLDFDGTSPLSDLSGNGNDGTPEGSLLYSSDIPISAYLSAIQPPRLPMVQPLRAPIISC